MNYSILLPKYISLRVSRMLRKGSHAHSQRIFNSYNNIWVSHTFRNNGNNTLKIEKTLFYICWEWLFTSIERSPSSEFPNLHRDFNGDLFLVRIVKLAAIKYRMTNDLHRDVVLLLYGSSEIGAHMWSDLGNLTSLIWVVKNLIFFSVFWVSN